ncbi:MAG: hypothetical protein ACREQR_00135 [Candidatus Binataceae bacterium]
MPPFRLLFTDEARRNLGALERDRGLAKRLKAVRKTLGLLETNPRHPSLNTHEYSSLSGPRGEKIFEAYAENRTAAAFRVFWHYGAGAATITIIAITAHP